MMLRFKFLFSKIFFILFIIFSSIVYADDIKDMKSISVAAGNSAEKAVEQLLSDVGIITKNLDLATKELGSAKTDEGSALDTTLIEISKAMNFTNESLAKGDITAAIQTMSLIESAIDLALASTVQTKFLDVSKIDFAKDFTPTEIIVLSNLVGQNAVGKVVALQKMAAQIGATNAVGFDSIGMIRAMDDKGIGIAAAMTEMSKAGIIDMKSITGTANFTMDNFNPARFASMNVVEMGMSPTIMIGALTVLPVGSATAALESLQSGSGKITEDFANLSVEVMSGSIASTMVAKGMGPEMMSAMESSIGITGISNLADKMRGVTGIEAMSKAIGTSGISKIVNALSTAFSSPETGIATAMNASLKMVSEGISEKPTKTITVFELGSAAGSVAASINETAPTAIEVPENVSASGIMMGAMVMAKAMMAGGLPGVMAPPTTMTPAAYIEAQEKIDKLN